MDPSTTKFQQALPYALLPVSPSLAALHSVRVKTSSGSCQQCGCLLHRGESSVRTVRSKASKSQDTMIQTTCLVCGWVQALPVARGNAVLFPRTRRPGAQRGVEKTVVHETLVLPNEKTIQPVPEKPPPKPSTPTQTAPAPASMLPKARSKKKGGLQSMLERNRERQTKEKQSGNTTGGGLAMFLNKL